MDLNDLCVSVLGPEKGVLENRQKVVVFRLNDMGFKQKMPSFYAYLY